MNIKNIGNTSITLRSLDEEKDGEGLPKSIEINPGDIAEVGEKTYNFLINYKYSKIDEATKEVVEVYFSEC